MSKFVYLKKSGQVRKVEATNKKAIDGLKQEGFSIVELDGKGKITVNSASSNEVAKLKAENKKLKAQLKELQGK